MTTTATTGGGRPWAGPPVVRGRRAEGRARSSHHRPRWIEGTRRPSGARVPLLRRRSGAARHPPHRGPKCLQLFNTRVRCEQVLRDGPFSPGAGPCPRSPRTTSPSGQGRRVRRGRARCHRLPEGPGRPGELTEALARQVDEAKGRFDELGGAERLPRRPRAGPTLAGSVDDRVKIVEERLTPSRSARVAPRPRDLPPGAGPRGRPAGPRDRQGRPQPGAHAGQPHRRLTPVPAGTPAHNRRSPGPSPQVRGPPRAGPPGEVAQEDEAGLR